MAAWGIMDGPEAPGGQGPNAAPECCPGSSFQVRRAASRGRWPMTSLPPSLQGLLTSSSCWTNVRSTGAASSARAHTNRARATCGPSTSTCTAPGCSYKTQSLGLVSWGVFCLRVMVKLHVFTLEEKKNNTVPFWCFLEYDQIPVDGFSCPVSLPILPRPPRSLDWEVEPCFTVVERVADLTHHPSVTLFRNLYFLHL